jgi:hypothetical protein
MVNMTVIEVTGYLEDVTSLLQFATSGGVMDQTGARWNRITSWFAAA